MLTLKDLNIPPEHRHIDRSALTAFLCNELFLFCASCDNSALRDLIAAPKAVSPRDAAHAAYSIFLLERAIEVQLDPSNQDAPQVDPAPPGFLHPVVQQQRHVRHAIDYACERDPSLRSLFVSECPCPRRLLRDDRNGVIPMIRELCNHLKLVYGLNISLSEFDLPPLPAE